MPIVAEFNGIKILFYWDEHPPIHFHVAYAEFQAQIDIDSLRVIKGSLPVAQYRKVVAWAKPRKSELLMAWLRCRSDLNPGRIP
jgi:hypothetical protein